MVGTLAPEQPITKAPEKPQPSKPVEIPKPIGVEELKLVATIDSLGGSGTRDPDRSLKAIAEQASGGEQPAKNTKTEIRVDTSDENLKKIEELRDPEKVGPASYGEGLVKKHHEGISGGDTASHESAQEKAYEDLEAKIEAGVVDPSQIGTEIVTTLGVKAEVESPPATHGEIPARVSKELDGFVDRNLITREEADVIMQEVGTFTQQYQEAYPEATAGQAFELVRNNARTIAYQTVRDKTVFSGSDHGIKHILQGNMKFADQMVASLEARGVVVTPKDKILIRQTIIDHDCGYTCGCAQAVTRRASPDGTVKREPGFEASKDHPLFSAKFVEANQEYYTRMFGEEGYKVIQKSILNHSYPTDLPQSLNSDLSIHEDLVRSITSTVDSLGVTAETKTPLFFTNPDAVRVLLKVRLALDTVGDGRSIPQDLMEKFKGEMREIAQRERNPDRQAGYVNSIDNFFNEFTAETTLGHFTGVVDTATVVQREDGKLVPQIDMHMSKIHALLGNLFGGKLEIQAFSKAMGDFGMGKEELQRMGLILESARAMGVPLSSDNLTFDSQQARFILSPELADNARAEFAGVQEVMSEVYTLSIRSEINRALSEINVDGVGAVGRVQQEFIASISEKTTVTEQLQLRELISQLTDTSPTGEVGKDGSPISVYQKAQEKLKKFLTQNEKDFLYGETVTT